MFFHKAFTLSDLPTEMYPTSKAVDHLATEIRKAKEKGIAQPFVAAGLPTFFCCYFFFVRLFSRARDPLPSQKNKKKRKVKKLEKLVHFFGFLLSESVFGSVLSGFGPPWWLLRPQLGTPMAKTGSLD